MFKVFPTLRKQVNTKKRVAVVMIATRFFYIGVRTARPLYIARPLVMPIQIRV